MPFDISRQLQNSTSFRTWDYSDFGLPTELVIGTSSLPGSGPPISTIGTVDSANDEGFLKGYLGRPLGSSDDDPCGKIAASFLHELEHTLFDLVLEAQRYESKP